MAFHDRDKLIIEYIVDVILSKALNCWLERAQRVVKTAELFTQGSTPISSFIEGNIKSRHVSSAVVGIWNGPNQDPLLVN